MTRSKNVGSALKLAFVYLTTCVYGDTYLENSFDMHHTKESGGGVCANIGAHVLHNLYVRKDTFGKFSCHESYKREWGGVCANVGAHVLFNLCVRGYTFGKFRWHSSQPTSEIGLINF